MNPMIKMLMAQLEKRDPKKAHLIKLMMQNNSSPEEAIKQAIQNGDITAQDYQQFKSAYKQGRIPLINITDAQFKSIDKVVPQQNSGQFNKGNNKNGFRF